MPIYEYVCNACGHEKEILQRLSDAKLTECPLCGKPDFIKKISAPGFRLKGGGWYETDFKTGKKKNIAGTVEADGKSADSKTTDNKPAESKTTDTKAAPKTDGNAKKGAAGKADSP